MKIITEPRVHLFSSQVFHPDPEDSIVGDGDNAISIGAYATRGCYDSYNGTGRGSDLDNQRNVIDLRHGSVLEHVVFGLRVRGVTRALSLESNRHRHFGISQRSTRYTAEEDAAIVLEPYYAELYERFLAPEGQRIDASFGLIAWATARDRFGSAAGGDWQFIHDHLRAAYDSVEQYKREVEWLMERAPGETKTDKRKWSRGKARNILPHSLETRFAYTGNVRAWRWFIEQRSKADAEDEIRRLSHVILTSLMAAAPVYFEDFEVLDVTRGIPSYVPRHSKV